MARRDYRQLNFADALLGGGNRKHARLDRLYEIHELIAWDAIDALLAAINSANKGADGYPPLCLFKALLLSIWYNLSDAKLEDALADRLSSANFAAFRSLRKPLTRPLSYASARRCASASCLTTCSLP